MARKQDEFNMCGKDFHEPGYVYMAPLNKVKDYSDYEPGYVYMAPQYKDKDSSDHVLMKPLNSDSIESGTPSTDERFAGIHLDKVRSYITTDEDNPIERQTRAYSVGSKPCDLREKIDKISSVPMTRAFSVGSSGQYPPFGLVYNSSKSSSTNMSVHSDGSDHIAMDFRNNHRYRERHAASLESFQLEREKYQFGSTTNTSSDYVLTDRPHPKFLSSSLDNKKSGSSHSVKSLPAIPHTLKRVSEVPNTEFYANALCYLPMKPIQKLPSIEKANKGMKDSSKSNYATVWEAASNSFPLKKMIGGLTRKKNKELIGTPVQKNSCLPIPLPSRNVDEPYFDYVTIKPGGHITPIQPKPQMSQSSKKTANVLFDGIAGLTLSDTPNHGDPQNHP